MLLAIAIPLRRRLFKGSRSRNAGLASALVGVVLLAGTSATAADSQPTTELLWPDGAPGAHGSAETDKPTLTIWLPQKPSVGTGVVVCPGGGYGGLDITWDEGAGIARWLNSLGVAAFVLKYRQRGSGYGHPAPLDDAQRGLRIVRARAQQWQLDPERIGIAGSSAGGHLASTAATHFDAGHKDASDPIERVGCRPDFLVLVYPVISFTSQYTHQDSKRNLLGNQPAAELTESLSNEKQVTAQTPPTFLVHTNEDTLVPAENSVLFYLALRRAKVPAELHIFEKGRHGLGLGRDLPGFGNWPSCCAEWMQGRGLLPKEGTATNAPKR